MAIEAGHYKAVVEEPEIRVSAKKEQPCIHATIRITEDGPHKGTRLPWEGWLTDSAAERTIKSMAFAGCTFPPQEGSEDPDLENFEGCGSVEVDVQIEIEEYTPEATEQNPNPRTSRRPRVAFINPLGGEGRTSKRIEPEQRTMIAKTWAGTVAKVLAERSNASASAQGDTSFDTQKLEEPTKPAAAKPAAPAARPALGKPGAQPAKGKHY